MMFLDNFQPMQFAHFSYFSVMITEIPFVKHKKYIF